MNLAGATSNNPEVARVTVRVSRQDDAGPCYSARPTCTPKLNQQLTASPFFLAGANVH
jgi:hypothetical protein